MTENRDASEHPTPRGFVAKSLHESHVDYGSLNAARTRPNGCVVITGDWGGYVCLTVPASRVACDEAELALLAADLDAVSVMGPSGSIEVAFEEHAVGSTILGGAGGAPVEEGAWIHPRFREPQVRSQATEVVEGTRHRVDVMVLRRARMLELNAIRSARLSRWEDSPPRVDLRWDFDIHPPAVAFD